MKLTEEKKALREKMIGELQKVPISLKKELSLKITQHFLNYLKSQKVIENVLLYSPLEFELDLSFLFYSLKEMKINIYLPKILKKRSLEFFKYKSEEELIRGPFNIKEPPYNEENKFKNNLNSLIVTPGIAFDLLGNRLGRGGGFYDAFLKGINFLKVALVFDFQIIYNVPCEDFDEKIDTIITQKGIVFKRRV